MSDYTLNGPLAALDHARLDNLVRTPASLLRFRVKWQEIANSLPKGSVLIIVPASETPQKAVLQRVAALYQSKGHSVTCSQQNASASYFLSGFDA